MENSPCGKVAKCCNRPWIGYAGPMGGLDGAVDQVAVPLASRDVVDRSALKDLSGGRDLMPRKRALATAFGDLD